jgi:predicted O-linked N-acetylglucosamine transferase (SPINDLY family)
VSPAKVSEAAGSVSEADLERARVLLASGEAAAALGRCRTVLERSPRDAVALHLSALACSGAGDLAAAENFLRGAIDLRPEEPRWWRDLGVVYLGREDWPSALGALNRAVELDPSLASAHALLGGLQRRLWRFEESQSHFTRALELQPERSAAWFSAANAYWLCGQPQKALAAYRRAVDLAPANADLHSVLLSKLLYDSDETPESIVQESRNWARLHCAVTTPGTYPNIRDPERQLRIGYLTGSFISSPTYHFALPIMKNHDLAHYDTYLYHSAQTRDAATAEFERVAGHWREVHQYSDEEVEVLVRKDAIDILVDMSGHYPGHRLQVFTRRPAPVQAVIPNYPATTGVSEIDYILTDERTCPEGLECQYIERAMRLNTWYLPYQAPPSAPDVTALPCLSRGEITFGLIQRRTKLNDRVWDLVAGILRRVPRSRLLVHFGWPSLDDPSDPVCRSLAGELEARGVSPERIVFRGWRPLVEHLRILSEIDIALDTFPYNGHTTTCECLWMGVPVVTMAGRMHVSRVGYGILHQLGLDEWAARCGEGYVRIAEKAAADVESLAEVRRGLRDRMRRSPLDGHIVTREIERAYRTMWREWCADQEKTV